MLALVTRRSLVASRLPVVGRAAAVRMYSDKPTSAGATAQSTSFKNREQAQEAKYIQEQEREKLRKLQESIKKQREDLDKLEQSVNEAAGSLKK